jgi:hypothetical protein
MAKSHLRLPKLANWMAGLYLIYSLLVYFGTLVGVGHEWWPIWLYPVIWPLSLLLHLAENALPPTALGDYIMGTFYIVVGTVWMWLLGRLISMTVTKLFSQPHTET